MKLSKKIHTSLGIIAILCWSTTFAFSRSLIEQLGIFTTVASMFLIGGILGCLVLLRNKDQRQNLISLSRHYLLICGFLFVFYMTCVYLAIGFVSTRQQVIEIGLINYLWPGLTMVFSVFILGHKARAFLIPGIIIATAGVSLATIYGESFSFSQTICNFQINWFAYILALFAAISWALYSNLARLWSRNSTGQAVPVFILIIGILFFIICLFFPETSNWNLQSVLELIYMAVVTTFLGYLFWDNAVKNGDIVVVVSFSYLTPLLATLFSCLYLNLKSGWVLWLACGLVLAGSIICKFSLIENRK